MCDVKRMTKETRKIAYKEDVKERREKRRKKKEEGKKDWK